MTRPARGRQATEAAITRIATGQHGVVTRKQLLAAGVTPDTVDGQLQAGRLRPIHRGVYLVGPVTAARAQEMAAVLACGRWSVVGRRSAGVLWSLFPGAARPSMVEVIVRRGHHRRTGIRTFHIRTLTADEVTQLDGIPITTPARTLLDLASDVGPRELERALAQAYAHRLATPEQIRALLDRHKGWEGSRRLRGLVAAGQPPFTRSEAEERFLALIRDGGLAAPEVNVVVSGYEVDFLWRSERLVAEIDGYAFHTSPQAFERDRRRDQALTAAGLRVMRMTWRQLVDEPKATLVRVAQALVRTGHP